MPQSSKKDPVEPQTPDNAEDAEINQDDAQLEESEDDAFDEEGDDTANVSE